MRHGYGLVWTKDGDDVEVVTNRSGRPALQNFDFECRLVNMRRMDIRKLGGSGRGLVLGGVAQELDIPSARVLWEWRSLDHVPVGETYATKIGYPWDYFHINSIDLVDDGHFLISGRNVWSVVKVRRDNGKIVWRLGGKRSDFTLGKGARFAFQHDARHHGGGSLITIFDNGAGGPR